MFKSLGHTLLELIVTTAVISIVVGAAWPALTHLLASSRQTAHLNNFVTSILLARSIAATQNEYAVVCPSLDLQTCAHNADWNHGWIVVSAAIPPEQAAFETTAQLQHIQDQKKGINVASNRNRYVFRPFSRRATNGTITFCHSALQGKAVIVSYNGRGRRSNTYANGEPIECL